MVAVVLAGDVAAPEQSEQLAAFGWQLVAAPEPTLDAVLRAQRMARRCDRHVVAMCAGRAAPLGAALATEGTLDAVISLGPMVALSTESVGQVRSPWLVVAPDDDREQLEPLALALEKAAVPGTVVRYPGTVSLAAADVRARVVTWIEHWIG